MRSPGRKVAGAVLLAAVTSWAATASADFNPFGRRPGKKPPAGAPSPARPTRPKPPGEPTAAPRPPAARSPAEGGRHPEPEKNAALVARYLGLALARPAEPFPVERLVELYRTRDGNVDALVAELQARADAAPVGQTAALVVLAGVLRHDGQLDRAVATYERAVAASPRSPDALLALGRLLASRGDLAGARQRFEAALPLVTQDPEREPLLRTLLGLCLDLRDVEGARRAHRELVQRAHGSFFVRAELGRELAARGENAAAEEELREVAKAAGGDNRALAPALRDLGQVLARQGKADEALEVLKRALAAAGGQSGLRREVLSVMAEVHRARGGVAALVTLLEQEHPDDFDRLVLLAGLYEETGRVDDALAAYRRALARKDDLATRTKVVQLLQVEGKLDEVVAEYGKLIRGSPHDPELVFRLVETLIQRGDRARARAELARLEARGAGDEDTLTALVGFYERMDDDESAGRLLDRLSRAGGGDPRHLVELGDHYFRQGDTRRALETWERIRVVVPDRARGLHALGEVLLEHDMEAQALDALREAAELAPREVKYQRALALALERAGTTAAAGQRAPLHEAARKIWDGILTEHGDDAALAREARQHLVTIWNATGRLAEHSRPLERRLSQSPPDLDAGRLLAEVYARLRRPADTERVLRAIIARAPGDVEAFLALERALVVQHALDRAIPVLEQLVKLDGRRAREYYQRMAQYSAEIYRDDDAVRYASRAVELSPDDAEGHRKLGEMYRRRQEVDRAIAELRLALAKNDRLFPVYFDLAELLLTRGEVEEADRLLRRVVRAAPDDELVARAARLSMQVNLGRGTLPSLERDLLPVALGNPGRPVFRRLLVEVYGNIAFPLVNEARSAVPERARAAREELVRLGERAVKPLLDALSDDRDTQQRTAVELLSRVSNASAGPSLVAFALGKADSELRTRAMLAVGALGEPKLLPRLWGVMERDGRLRADETDPVAVAAAWGVARLRHPTARPRLLAMLSSDAPSIASLGAIGLGLLGKGGDTRALVAAASSPEQSPLVRAAAAFALGAASGPGVVEALSRLSEAKDPAVRGQALIALARQRAPGARRSIAASLVSPDPTVRDAAAVAALVASTGRFSLASEPLPLPDGRVDMRAVLAGLRPTGFGEEDRAGALADLVDELLPSAITAVHSGPESARVVGEALLAGDGGPAFAPLVTGLGAASEGARARGEAAALRLASGLVEPFLSLTRHPTIELRLLSLRVLSRRPEPAARDAVAAAVTDPDPLVQRTALSLLPPDAGAEVVATVAAMARDSGDWSARARAAEALGQLGRGPAGAAAVGALAAVAERDPVALARESAVRALGALGTDEARATLGRVETTDAEPRLRELARALRSRRDAR